MLISVKRTIRTDLSTISKLYINGLFSVYILEDKDRGLSSSMTLDQIKAIKIKGQTAIPTGRYQLVISYSERFGVYLPLLLNVPGYSGIRIHPGNAAADTDGCLLPGMDYTQDRVMSSRTAFTKLMSVLMKVEKKEEIWVVVE